MQGSKRGERSAVEKPLRGNPKTGFPLRLEIPQTARDSHFPTATAAAVRLHRKCPDNTPESYIPKWLDTATVGPRIARWQSDYRNRRLRRKWLSLKEDSPSIASIFRRLGRLYRILTAAWSRA